jgi:hypothetical protein
LVELALDAESPAVTAAVPASGISGSEESSRSSRELEAFLFGGAGALDLRDLGILGNLKLGLADEGQKYF